MLFAEEIAEQPHAISGAHFEEQLQELGNELHLSGDASHFLQILEGQIIREQPKPVSDTRGRLQVAAASTAFGHQAASVPEPAQTPRYPVAVAAASRALIHGQSQRPAAGPRAIQPAASPAAIAAARLAASQRHS